MLFIINPPDPPAETPLPVCTQSCSIFCVGEDDSICKAVLVTPFIEETTKEYILVSIY